MIRALESPSIDSMLLGSIEGGRCLLYYIETAQAKKKGVTESCMRSGPEDVKCTVVGGPVKSIFSFS